MTSLAERDEAAAPAAAEPVDFADVLRMVKAGDPKVLAALTNVLSAAGSSAAPTDAPLNLAAVGERLGFAIDEVRAVGDGWTIRGRHPGDGREVTVQIENSAALLSCGKVEQAVVAGVGIVVKPPLGKIKWRPFAQAILDHAVKVEGVPTDVDQTLAWIRGAAFRLDRDLELPEHASTRWYFYNGRTGTADRDAVDAHRAAAWREGGLVAVHLPSLADHLQEVRHLKMSHLALGKRLDHAGFETIRRSTVHPKSGERKQCKLWLAPLEVLDEA